jgi:glycosyltransferase involved in cell wall biosynthesis
VKRVTVVVPGSISMRTGGSIYDRRMAEGLQARGWNVGIVEIDPITHPLAPPIYSAPPQFSSIPDGNVVLIDGLAFGTMPHIIEHEAWRLRFVPIVHMPLANTPGLTPGEGAWLSNLERRALQHARHVVITGSRAKAPVQALTGWSDSGPITRIAPGTDRRDETDWKRFESARVWLLCVANVTPGKGHDILLKALADMQHVDWTLACVGSEARDPHAAGHVRKLAEELGIASRVIWRGALDDAGLEDAYATADLFALATRSETYGMAVAEAISHGLPVVSTRTGEIPSIVGDAGLLAEPGDAAGFGSLLAQALSDAGLRQSLRDRTSEAASRLPTWDEAADAMASVLTKVAESG